MQIGGAVDNDTYAIVGGGQASKFRVAENAESFHLLSDTLYRDKTRAVVREYICNAVDAHIESGIEATPIAIELDDNEFRVRDLGAGIEHMKIADVFCTLFASSKRADGRQTGGFGLGCKSGFAVSDHFSVVNRHNGIQTVYVAHKGDEASDGMPVIRAMTSVPTTETGITVIVPLPSPESRHEFSTAIRVVVAQGGMKATLNGEILLAFDHTALREHGYGIVAIDTNLNSKIEPLSTKMKVLFGNVMYPLEPNERLQPLIERYGKLHFQGRDSRPDPYADVLVLHAPPSSVKPALSRESLSYNTLTLDTLEKLLLRVCHELETSSWKVMKRELGLLVDQIKPGEYSALYRLIGPGSAFIKKADAFLEGVDIFAGAEVMSTVAAYSRIRHREFGEEQVLNIARKRHKIWSTARNLAEQDRGYNKRRALRCIPPHLGKYLRGVDQRSGMLFPAVSKARLDTDRKSFAYRDPRHIDFGKTIVFVDLVKNIPEATKDLRKKLYVVHPRLDPTDRAYIERQALRYGFAIECVIPEVVKAAKPLELYGPFFPADLAARSLPAFAFETTRGVSNYHSQVGIECPKSVIDPTLVIYTSTSRSYGDSVFTIPDFAKPLPSLLAKLLPDDQVGIVRTLNDAKRAYKRGVRPLEDRILEMARARLAIKKNAAREKLYQSIAVQTLRQDFVGKITRASRELACALLGHPYRVSAVEDEALLFWRVFHIICSSHWVRINYEWIENDVEVTPQTGRLAVTIAAAELVKPTSRENLNAAVEKRFSELTLDLLNTHVITRWSAREMREHKRELLFLIKNQAKFHADWRQASKQESKA
jgi:hypothetical protein